MPRRRRQTDPGPYVASVEMVRDRVADPSAYPFCLPVVRNLDSLPLHPRVTFLVGENGSGKSTLLEAIAHGYRLNPEGGSRNFRFSTRESHSALGDCVRLARTPAIAADAYFLRAESFYNVATEIERLDREPGGPKLIEAYGGVSLHDQSHGESFFALFRNRFRDHGFYLMDEPEAALSPQRQLSFLAILHDYVKRGGQFVIATHSPIILAYPDALIYQIDGGQIAPTAYHDTQHFQVTRGFLANPARALRILLGDEPDEGLDADRDG